MRIPLITPLASRNGTVEKDERLVNCYGEQDVVTKETRVIKRAGIDEGDAMLTGPDIYGQGIFNYDGYVFAVMNDVLGYWIYVGGSGPGGGGGGTYISFGVPEWDAGTTYNIGNAVFYNGNVYYSHSNNNTGNVPTTPVWSTSQPGTSTYQGTISWGGTGAVSASVVAAGYSAYLACPYNSCPNRRTDTNQWLTYDSMSGNNIRCRALGVYSPNFCSGSINDFGVATYGTVTQLS